MGSSAVEPTIPIDGPVILYTCAVASIPARAMAPVLREVQAHLHPQQRHYARHWECAIDAPTRAIYLVEPGHWDTIGSELSFDRREQDAVERAHRRQLLMAGRAVDRRDEFETALEIRTAVVIGTDEASE
jgi:hypothetical protein